MRIKELSIKHFKGFDDLNLPIDRKSIVLFGVNGVGKSTVLSAINYIFRPFLAQLNPMQSKTFGSFEDGLITIGADSLQMSAIVSLGGNNHILTRYYKRTQKNDRTTTRTYPQSNYSYFKDSFQEKFLKSGDDIGMPVFVHYGTNRTVMNVSLNRSRDIQYDKLSALERVVETDSDFRSFFEWYLGLETSHLLDGKNQQETDQNETALKSVNRVIEYMLGDVNNLEARNNPLRMVVQKGGKEIRIDLLSDGEKCTLALLGDLTRRLILANPKAENPLDGTGIVLIDEIELHMHPSWQRRILPTLQHLFPNIQFIVTTHSPQVLGEATDEFKIVSLYREESGKSIFRLIDRMDGYDSNLILEDYMNTPSVSRYKQELISKINLAIRDEQYTVAEEHLEQLKALSGESDYDYLLLSDYLRRSKS